jgi:hypothetical protein
MDSVGGNKERNPVQCGVEEGAPDMQDHGVSDTQRRQAARALARACWASGWIRWARPKAGKRRSEDGRARGRLAGRERGVGCWAES